MQFLGALQRDERRLFQDRLRQVDRHVMPGLSKMTWNRPKAVLDQYFNDALWCAPDSGRPRLTGCRPPLAFSTISVSRHVFPYQNRGCQHALAGLCAAVPGWQGPKRLAALVVTCRPRAGSQAACKASVAHGQVMFPHQPVTQS